MSRFVKTFGLAALGFVLVVGIGRWYAGLGGDEPVPESAFHPDGWTGAPPAPRGLYDPVRAGEQMPQGFRQLLVRDAIAPIYDPTFFRPEEVPWPDDELVIGVEIDGDARAYPVGYLNRREIVVDMHRGTPTFVTW